MSEPREKRCDVRLFRCVRFFANTRCKMHDARCVLARFEKPLFIGFFRMPSDRGEASEGGRFWALALCPSGSVVGIEERAKTPHLGRRSPIARPLSKKPIE